MAVGVWEPGGGVDDSREVPLALIEQFLALARQVDESVTPVDLEAAGLSAEQWVMTTDAAGWGLAESLDDADLEHLARLFTLVEQQVSGWDGGKKSPVIAIVKILKGRDAFAPELRKWIKTHTDNRYLPYGSAL